MTIFDEVAYLTFKSIFLMTLNLFKFDCEITLVSVPATVSNEDKFSCSKTQLESLVGFKRNLYIWDSSCQQWWYIKLETTRPCTTIYHCRHTILWLNNFFRRNVFDPALSWIGIELDLTIIQCYVSFDIIHWAVNFWTINLS